MPKILTQADMSAKGRLLYVMGSSGAGKDSVLNAVRPRAGENVRFARRLITREPDPLGENNVLVTERRFAEMLREGEFSLHWESHGLKYGIGRDIDEELACGNTVIVNGSRENLERASRRYPDMEVVEITADPAFIQERLRKRNREGAGEISRRLARGRQAFAKPDFLVYHTIDNSGNLADSAQQLLAIIKAPANKT